MIKVTKFGSLPFDKVAYLSFNIQPEFNIKSARLLIYFRPYQTYIVRGTSPLLLRKISPGVPTMMEYLLITSGYIEFIPAPDDRLYLLRHYD